MLFVFAFMSVCLRFVLFPICTFRPVARKAQRKLKAKIFFCFSFTPSECFRTDFSHIKNVITNIECIALLCIFPVQTKARGKCWFSSRNEASCLDALITTIDMFHFHWNYWRDDVTSAGSKSTTTIFIPALNLHDKEVALVNFSSRPELHFASDSRNMQNKSSSIVE